MNSIALNIPYKKSIKLTCVNNAKADALKYDLYTKIENIPSDVFNKLTPQNSYISIDYLQAIELANPEVEFAYIVLYDKNQIAGFAITQIVKLSLNNQISVSDGSFFSGKILEFAKKYSHRKPFRIMVCGNIFISGENGFALTETNNEKEQFQILVKTLEQIARSENGISVQAILFKEFYSESETMVNSLENSDYRQLCTEPLMVLDIDKSWCSFEDYLQAMKAKYRTKAKKALKESAVLEVSNLSAQDIKSQMPTLKKLYDNVESKAGFSLGKIQLETYVELKQKFPKEFIFKTYNYNGNIVGFLSGFVNGKTLDAHYVGLDYDYNRKLYVYQRMLYDYVELALELKVEKLNFGRSAGEIKSTVGAKPVDMHCYLKHRYPLHNTFLKPILDRIKPDDFKLIMPFK